MARQRKLDHGSNGKKGGCGAGLAAHEPEKSNTFKCLLYWRYCLGCSCLIIAIVVGYVGYLETRVNTPFTDRKVVTKSALDVPDLYWGTYRPGHYLGFKARNYHSPVMGLMWYMQKRLTQTGDGIRHWYRQEDGLSGSGWIRHDGVWFGEQQLFDSPHLLTMSFVKRPAGSYGGDWTVRITVNSTTTERIPSISLVWYVALDTSAPAHELLESFLRPETDGAYAPFSIVGNAPSLGAFNVQVKAVNSGNSTLHTSFTACLQGRGGLAKLKETLASSMRLANYPKTGEKLVLLDGEEEPGSNFIAIQLTGTPPLTADVIYESDDDSRTNRLTKSVYSDALSEHRRRFDERFEKTFRLAKKGYGARALDAAKAALSNLIGGIGYFYGSSRVQSSYTKEPVPYWKAPLYTAVPSRSKFPRGFLWDEGFHAALIGRWDRSLLFEIASHWLDLMNVEGWIPREQILGPEALDRVPEEFVTQKNTNANPPMLLITIANTIAGRGEPLAKDEVETVRRMYTRLQAWYDWFNTTQRGAVPTAFRWRGRNATTERELNPITLTSGLDDYPRASHPTDFERHIDLRCWMFAAADAITKIAQLIDKDASSYEAARDQLGDQRLLDELHWSPFTETYSDYGLHTDAVKLARLPNPSKNPGQKHRSMELVRVVMEKPRYRYVDTTFGYVSLFPVLMKVLKPNSPRLGKVLDDLGKSELLWTPYGLRSLSPNSPLYNTFNTEHSAPYWRGPIWINLNYLALSALWHYSNLEGPHQEKAAQLYDALRDNVVGTILGEYDRTGYYWEQYSDLTGHGQSSAPFTGWTSLVVLIMAEYY